MYSHPHGRFVPNITPIPGQGYVYHPSAGVHPGLQHAPSALSHATVPVYPQPQTTATAQSTVGYHPSPTPAIPSTLQPQYITPAETVHPLQAPSLSIKIEKSAEDASLIYQRNQPAIIQKQLNQTHQIITATPQPTLATPESELARQRTEQDVELSRQHAAKMLLQQQQSEQQQMVAAQEAAAVATQAQKEQQERGERERRERDIQRQKVIEDHQKQKNSNRIFTNSSKNLSDVTKIDTMTHSTNTKSVPTDTNISTVSTSPAEHGFRKITAPLGLTNPPKPRSPLPQLNVKLYKCIICGFLADSAVLLGRHAFEMHEKRSRKWKVGQKVPVRHECEECDYETSDIHRLHRHMQRVHDTDQVFHFQCKECDFVATSADLLGRHALEMHEVGSIFRCSLCDFVSNRKRDRDRHHTGAHQLDYDTYMTSSGGLPPSKQMYYCLVPTCKEQIRGDKLRDHYKKYVKFVLLEESPKKQDRKLQLLSSKEAEHTQFFSEEQLDSHSMPGYKRHKKVTYIASSSDADSSFDKREPRKRKKRRGRPPKRPRSREDWDKTDTEEEEERELKKELKELGVKGLHQEENDSDISSSAVEEKIQEEKIERVKEKPIECEVVVKTTNEVSDEDEVTEAHAKEEVFPKKCNLCCEEKNDKVSMIEHIRNKHILKSSDKSESTKPKFEIIRQKPSKCLDIIREEAAKRN